MADLPDDLVQAGAIIEEALSGGYLPDDSFMAELMRKVANQELTNEQALEHTINRHPDLQGVFRFNELTLQYVITKELPQLSSVSLPVAHAGSFPILLEKYHVQLLGAWMRRFGLKANKDTLEALVMVSANHHTYNPIRAYLEGLQWDGTERLSSLWARSFSLENTAYLQEIGRRWMVAAIGRALATGHKPYKFDWLPVLIGGQGNGKSTFSAILFGEWNKEGLPANLADKDAKQELQGVWGVELSELTSLRRSENEAIKAFLSAMVDKYRPSYGRTLQTYPRRCVFIGTTNEEEFLTDGTGNRRFMPINIGSHCLDFGWLAENRDQLWAEAYRLFCKSPAFETCEPSDLKEEIERIRRESMVSDILEESVINLIKGDILPDADGKGGFTVASIIRALSLPMTRAMEMRVSNILRNLGGEKQRQRKGKGRFYVWQFNHMVTG
ncbi:virulence-associated E family protein [Bombella apis]|uniref:virulence-associated E family protein n=1 Tax=Bombella apis TaxID=1785988 RepID=UPI0023FA3298|nr:virulence-associated E family protein [Bombella apis]MCT6814461.1 virulence-associated E family protein [Bombella apis]